MQIGFLEIRKTNVNVYGDGVNFFLGKDMMTYSVTWVKGKKKRWAQISQKCPQLSPK